MFKLALQNVWYFRLAIIPVLLAVAVGSAVLTGSLMVGDSLRGSLKTQSDGQLAGVDATWMGSRLIRSDIAMSIPGATPALVIQGSVETRDKPGAPARRVPRVTVWGVTESGGPPRPAFDGDRVIQLSQSVAAQLQVKDGDTVKVGVEAFSAVPRGSLLGRRAADDVAKTLTLVAKVLPADSQANLFAVVPTPNAPLNVYIPLEELQKRLDIPGKCNALLFTQTGQTLAQANTAFTQALTLTDWGVRITVPSKRNAYVSVESETLVLDGPTVAAIEQATTKRSLQAERTLVYLVNEIGTPTKGVPYSLVCATNLSAKAPLGPMLQLGVTSIKDDEIVLVNWPDSPLATTKAGDAITLRFFQPELEAGEKEIKTTFKSAGLVAINGATDDPNLTPPFPGITDKLEVKDWNPPFTFEKWRIEKADEEYWNKYRTTPKAYINLQAGEKLFGSRFGTVTSVRIAPAPNQTPAQTLIELSQGILSELDANAAGFKLESTRERMAAASQGGTDFGGLFLGFSFFLIAASLFLVGLMFRLMIERRAKNVGLLSAVGYAPSTFRKMFLVEGLVVASVGAILGLGAAYFFADQLLIVLKTLWPNPEAVSFLKVHVKPLTLAIGFVAILAMSLFAIRFALRGLLTVPTPSLLRGETTHYFSSRKSSRFRIRSWMLIAALVVALGFLAMGSKLPNPDFRAGSFFSGGGLLLIVGLIAFHRYLKYLAQQTTKPSRSVLALAIRNAARNPNRSVLTAGLIAAAAFLLVAVESFRRAPEKDFAEQSGGSGGFNLVGEVDVPLFQSPTSRGGLDDIERGLQAVYQNTQQPGATPAGQKAEQDTKLLSSLNVVSLSRHGGDDASCLNLYQAGRPRVLGIPSGLIERSGFRFTMTLAKTAEEKNNPWLLLNAKQPDDAIPAFVEQNSAMWMLKKGLGDVVEYPDEAGNMRLFRLVGFLQDCPFQSELLIPETAFRSLYPHQDGYRVFLIQTPAELEPQIKSILETGLRTHGMTVTPSRERVATFQAVVGTYLTLFQLLGGFGLLLGVLGLAAVLSRAVAERLGELALLRSIGFSRRDIGMLVISENLFVLAVGLVVGILAAALSVLPHVAGGATIPLTRLAIMLVAVFVAGVIAVVLATVAAVRVPLLPALRKE